MLQFIYRITINCSYPGRISLAEPLDFETQHEHVIPIRVDGLGLFAESTLTVQVIDLNEPHQITNLPFEATVNAETAKEGDYICFCLYINSVLFYIKNIILK